MPTPDPNPSQPQPDPTDWLVALLHEARPAGLADDGFSASVMQRIRTARVCAAAPSMPPDRALARLQRHRQQASRWSRWSVGGAVAGSVIAAATIAGNGDLMATTPVMLLTAWPPALALASLVLAALAFGDARD